MLSPCPSPCRCFGTRRKRAISQHLVSIFRSGTDCLEPLPDCLPSLALEYSFSSFYASSLSTTSAWGTDKGSENDTSKHVETICQFILSYGQGERMQEVGTWKD
ncbi:hypothetical protein ACFX2C_037943 [Malus domestica]